ncbi:MAG: hypothetical protein ACXAB7_12590 [Candidatus Kariarchaeaceae archaeon]|jgi:hypothetical protein
MRLVLQVDTPPPAKEYWHHPDPNMRKDWSMVFDAMVSWFCMSNGIRKENDAEIIVEHLHIIFKGKKLKYFAPSIRSAASLIWKAYQVGQNLGSKAVKESSPGVTVTTITDLTRYPKPWYHICFNHLDGSVPQVLEGTIFNTPKPNSISIQVPAIVLSQAIIWTFYGGNSRGISKSD